MSSQVEPRRSARLRNDKNTQGLSAQQLLDQISHAILARERQYLTFENVDSKVGPWVAASLDDDGRVESVGHR